MKKMLYCMHIGWNWIKQRPHFIAEELANEYDLTVISDYNYRVKRTSTKNEKVKIVNFYKIPKIDTLKHLSEINIMLRKWFYSAYIRKIKPDCVYVMTPYAVKCIPNWYKGTLIYDCMDDMISFDDSSTQREKILRDESALIDRAEIVFVSSENLKEKLKNRYSSSNNKKYVLVRNGYSGISPKLNEKTPRCEKSRHILCYFGTIASWLNFEYIQKSLEDFDSIEYLLIGPKQAGVQVPKHDRIKCIGPVAHDDLYENVKDVDALIMPFVLNDLIMSVDPVKLYEYINFRKNIICVEYPEVKRFSEFVYFYKDYESYANAIKEAIVSDKIKFSIEKQNEFLELNTWKVRAKTIAKVINNVLECKNAAKQGEN
ncbi:glycosyltransferase [Faecalibacterium prausnitzii]|jgi:teichuronic acid biosynthesis glycosyltransferase TuaH|uniref:glycosyltransferase n=1 Tax=Faecalibacterium prausnitzii TaxID=853 RepID=UPI000E412A0F|nr:glycosyltransferase [Faecalibacterium prausnitzii]RGC40419.1 glycosyltransferase [Faecalibacterium prausnitzii]